MQKDNFILEHPRLFQQVIVDNIECIIIIIDTHNNIVFANNITQKISGYAPEDVIGSNIVDHFPMLHTVLNNDQQSVIHRPKEIEIIHNRTGKKKIVTANIHEYEHNFRIIILKDITFEKAREEIFRFTLAFIDNTNTIAIACAFNGSIIFTNKEASRKLKYEHNDLLTMNIFDIIPVRHHHIIRNQMDFAQKDLSLSQELALITKENQHIDVIFNSRPIADLTEPAVIFTANDITLTKHIDKKFIQSSKMDSIISLAGGIAHDFNNLLTIIQGNSQLLEMIFEQDEKNSKRIKNISDAAQKASSLTNALLSFSKIKNKDVIPISIKQISKDVCSKLNEDAESKYSFYVESPLAMPIIMGNPDLIYQAISALCLNSKDMTPHGGDVHIALSEVTLNEKELKPLNIFDSHCIKLSITDARECKECTITEKVLTDKEVSQGMNDQSGVNLSIAYQIIKTLNGALSHTCSHDHKTTYNVYFPVTSLHSDRSVHQASDAPKRTLLVVDDQKMMLNLIEDAFSDDFNVITAESGEHAIEILEEDPHGVDIGIIDYYLLDMTGDIVVEKLRNINDQIKFVLMSGQPILDTIAIDVDGKIKKPFKITNLINMINEI